MMQQKTAQRQKSRQLEGLRVLFANSTMIRSALGGEKEVILQQARALASEGAKVDILTNYYEPEKAKEFEEFHVISIGLKKPDYFLGIRDTITLCKYWTMKLKKYDLLIVHDFPASILARRIQPAIYYSHVPNRTLYSEREVYIRKLPFLLRPIAWVYTAVLRTIDQSTMKKVGLMLANSGDAQEKIKTSYSRKSVVIPPGVNVEENFTVSFKRFILTASRLNKEKQIDIIIMAMKYLPDYELVVAGDGECKEEFMRLAETIGQNIKFVGRLSHDELKKLYRECFCVANVSKQEALGMVALEAQANGKVMIGAHGTGMLDYAKDPRTVILLQDNSPQNVARAVKKLEKVDLKKRAELCIANAKRFDWKIFQQRFMGEVIPYLKKEGKMPK